MKRTRKKTTKQETLQQPTVAITMTAEDKAAAEKKAAEEKAAEKKVAEEKAAAEKKVAEEKAAAEKKAAAIAAAEKEAALREAEAAQKAREDAIEAMYRKRFDRHFEELRWLYMELYGNSSMFAELCDNMKRFYMERNTDLRASDASREKRPDWYKQNDMMGMMFYIDNFAGNMKGVQKKLDYIEQCGVNYIHLMPFLDTPEGRSDGGYAVSDFRKVQEKLGTMEDLEHLTAACHEKDINVCMDFVMNHTSEDHEWAKRARQGDGEYMGRYFFFDNWDIPAKYEQTVPQVFPTTAPGNFTWLPDARHFVMTSFYPYQWDLNYRNPRVFNEMMYNFLFLANKGIDIVRIDAVPYIWKELGTTCRNLQQVHTIVRMMRMIGEIVCPGILLLGEVVMEPEKVVPYFGTVEKPECHMLYNVSTMVNLWSALASRDTRLLKAQLDALHALPKNCWFVNYLRCHDDIGWGLDEAVEEKLGIDPQKHKEYLYHFYEGNFPGSWAKGELYNYDPATGDARSCGTTASLCGVEQALEKNDTIALDYAVKRDLLLHTAMAFLQGFPMLNCGDEIAQLNGWDYKNDPDRVEDSRNLHRSKFNWENAKQRTRKGTLQNALWQGMEELRKMRADECFSPDAWVTTWDSHNPGVLALVRKRGEETLVGLFNFTEYPAGASLDALGGKYTTADGKTVWLADVELQPYQALLVKKA